jgi:serine/threonine protein kinase
MPVDHGIRVDGLTVSALSSRHAETFNLGLRSFINEAHLLAQFNHPSLVKVLRFWEANGTAYMVMPFYEGKTLKETLVEMQTPPSESWLRDFLAHILDALKVMHAEQCFHRDIAPDNILMTKDCPVLLDFGAARRLLEHKDQAVTAIFKPSYAPIEQYGQADGMTQGAWTDLYALASVMHLAIMGKLPPRAMERMLSDSLEPLARAAAVAMPGHRPRTGAEAKRPASIHRGVLCAA